MLALVCDIGGIIATLHLCDTVRFFLLFSDSQFKLEEPNILGVLDSDAKSRIVVLSII